MGEKIERHAKAPAQNKGNLISKAQKTIASQSSHSLSGLILHLHKTAGNRAVQRLFKSGVIQAKLKIGQPNDSCEQEADRVADQVMRMADPAVSDQPTAISKRRGSVQRKPGCPFAKGPACGADEAIQRQVEEEEELVQMKREEGGSLSLTSGMQSSIASQRGSGSLLPDSVRAFFEPRFGRDFSQVRLQTGSHAGGLAETLQARAFTIGSDIFFGRGEYQPDTSAGQQLLAHELSHTIQQGATAQRPAQARLTKVVSTAPVGLDRTIQRKIGFEFQTMNIMATNTRPDRRFGRKFNKYFHKGKTGVELQTDTGSVVEFETAPFSIWSKLEAQIQEAVDICRALNATFGKKPTFAWSEEHRMEQMFVFSEEESLKKKKVLEKGEKLHVKIKEPSFEARIQSTEGIALQQYESLLREHEKHEFINPVIKSAQRILDGALKGNKKVKPKTLDNLRGFLQVIINYISRAQTELWSAGAEKWSPVKATFRLMHRTDFSSMFNSLLTQEEKTLFEQIVKSNAIPQELGVAATSPLFGGGYWGHLGNMMALFDGGKVVALGHPENKKLVHDCSDKLTKDERAELKTKGIDVSKCGSRVPDSDIKVGAWLISIITKKKDLLSHPHEGSESMGKFAVHAAGEEKGLVIFETRGTRRERDLPINEWVDYAEQVFQQASVCRERRGTGTELTYDGSKYFTWGACLPPK